MDKEILKRLVSFVKPYRLYLCFSAISATVGVGLSLFTPILVGKAIDYIIGKDQVLFQNMIKILITLIIVILISSLFQWMMTYFTNRITFLTVKDLRKLSFRKINKVPLSYIDGHSHGDIMSRVVNDIDQISDGLLQGFAQLFTGVITIVGTLVFMLTIHKWITFLVVVLTPLSLFVASFIARSTFHKFKEQALIRGELGGYIEEMIGNQKVVKAFRYEDRSIENFKEMNKRLQDVGVMAQFYSSLTNPATRFVNGFVYATVGIFGALAAMKGHLTIGQILSFLTYANQYTKPFNEISGVVTELQSAMASARRVFEFIDEPEESSDENLLEDITCTGEVEIKDVNFSYDMGKPLIEDLNLKVEPGQRIAIVGPTGCGKTTIINLLMRFYDVTSGDITLSGYSIKDMKRKTLRSMYGMVLQETWLFHGTVWENIAYGKEDATEEEIVEAAKAAHAHSFIKRLPEGYDTIILEDGGNISQGQKQLLCIARIMLSKPPMLILDEATSNIDTRTEIRIQKAFARLMEGRTSFVVAHRLSTIKESDVILVMDQGHIIEKGTHDSLLACNGFYANLYNSQFKTQEIPSN
ncbi:MAG TPA: ABC transporter ATP-binding protein [Candidatus Merdenecus merdavium]|nr:ABC transporter ATP-binding protein [Candidatus Merdenecus merdavium]